MISSRLTGSDAALVSAALFAGAAGAAFLIISERVLGPAGFEPVAQLWTIWAITAAFLSFSIQLHTIGESGSVGAMLRPAMLGLIGGVAVVIAIVTIWFRVELFGSSAAYWPALAILLPFGAAGTGLARGYWAARRQFSRTGAVLAAENGIRLAIGALLAIVGASAGWFGLAIIVGFLPALTTPWSNVEASNSDSIGSSSATLSTGLSGLAAFTTLSSAPIVLAIAGASDETSAATFVALTLVRIPHGLVQGLIPRLSVAATTRSRADGDLSSWLRRVGAVVAVAAPVAAGLGALLLGSLASILFGDDNELSRAAYVLAALLGIFNLGIIAQTVVLTAAREHRRLVIAWLTAVPVSAALPLIDATDPVELMALLLVAELVAFVMMSVARINSGPTTRIAEPT